MQEQRKASAASPDRSWAVVVVNYGSHALLEENLAGTRAHVVVVDNFSDAAERAAVHALGEREGWEVLTPMTNLGFGAGVNLAVAHARSTGADAVVLLNPDAHADDDVLRALVEHCRREPLTMLSPRVLRPDGSVWFAGGQVLVDKGWTITTGADSSADGGWLSGACLALHSDLWDRVGGFDPDYFLYWEDVDLSWRVAQAGGHLLVRGDLEVVHSVGGTQARREPPGGAAAQIPGPTGSFPFVSDVGHAGKSSTYLSFNCRNRLIFAAKHLGRRDFLKWAIRSPAYARRVLLRGGRRALVRHPIGSVAAVVSGTVRGLTAAQRLRCTGPRRADH